MAPISESFLDVGYLAWNGRRSSIISIKKPTELLKEKSEKILESLPEFIKSNYPRSLKDRLGDFIDAYSYSVAGRLFVYRDLRYGGYTLINRIHLDTAISVFLEENCNKFAPHDYLLLSVNVMGDDLSDENAQRDIRYDSGGSGNELWELIICGKKDRQIRPKNLTLEAGISYLKSII